MYGMYANIGGILKVNVTIYGIHTDPMGRGEEKLSVSGTKAISFHDS